MFLVLVISLATFVEAGYQVNTPSTPQELPTNHLVQQINSLGGDVQPDVTLTTIHHPEHLVSYAISHADYEYLKHDQVPYPYNQGQPQPLSTHLNDFHSDYNIKTINDALIADSRQHVNSGNEYPPQQANVASHFGSIGTYQGNIGTNQENIDTNLGNIGGYQENIGTYQESIGRNQGNIGAYQGNIDTYQENIGTNQGKINAYQGNIGTYQENILATQGNIGAYQENIGTYQEIIGTTQGNIGAYQGNIGTYQENVPIVNPVVKKSVYFHVPPPDVEEPPLVVRAPPPKKVYKIIFIKVPSQETPLNLAHLQQALQVQQAPVQDKTLIYVLSKKEEPQQQVVVPKPTTFDHEVFFVKYNGDANNVAAQINDELDLVDSQNGLPVLQPGLANGGS